jgi:hypothetical protein
MRSNLKVAEDFQGGVTEEVLPGIRKTGAYVHAEKEDSDETRMIGGMEALARTTVRVEAQSRRPVHGPRRADQPTRGQSDECALGMVSAGSARGVDWSAVLDGNNNVSVSLVYAGI